MSEPNPRTRRRRRRLRRLVVALVSLALLVVLVQTVDLGTQLERLVQRVDELGAVAGLFFVLLHALAVVTLVPGILFPLGAGFLFGVWPGSLLSVFGKTLGSALSFLIARHLLQGLFPGLKDRLQQRHGSLQDVLHELPRGGWRAVLQIRLVPVIPFKVSSYVFGWTEFTFRHYVCGTFLATIPYSVLNAYLGSLAADLSQLGTRTAPRSPLEWTLYVSGILLACAACVLLVRRVRTILERAPEAEER